MCFCIGFVWCFVVVNYKILNYGVVSLGFFWFGFEVGFVSFVYLIICLLIIFCFVIDILSWCLNLFKINFFFVLYIDIIVFL